MGGHQKEKYKRDSSSLNDGVSPDVYVPALLIRLIERLICLWVLPDSQPQGVRRSAGQPDCLPARRTVVFATDQTSGRFWTDLSESEVVDNVC